MTLLQHDALLGRVPFGLVLIYGAMNFRTLRDIERISPSLVEIVASTVFAKYWMAVLVVGEALVAYYFVFSGRNLGEYLDGFGSLMMALLAPVLPALYAHQRAQFAALRRAG